MIFDVKIQKIKQENASLSNTLTQNLTNLKDFELKLDQSNISDDNRMGFKVAKPMIVNLEDIQNNI